jgi:hypothetical protein
MFDALPLIDLVVAGPLMSLRWKSPAVLVRRRSSASSWQPPASYPSVRPPVPDCCFLCTLMHMAHRSDLVRPILLCPARTPRPICGRPLPPQCRGLPLSNAARRWFSVFGRPPDLASLTHREMVLDLLGVDPWFPGLSLRALLVDCWAASLGHVGLPICTYCAAA